MQYDLFTELSTGEGKLTPDQPEATRRAYTMNDYRETKEYYTGGNLNGYAMARKLGRGYRSFKQFVKRNPELKKKQRAANHNSQQPFKNTPAATGRGLFNQAIKSTPKDTHTASTGKS